jgi:hypothetical protein
MWSQYLSILLVPAAYALIAWGAVDNKMEHLAQADIDTQADIERFEGRYVPRTEIDAKLQTIQVQVGAVQANVEDLKEQSERQTAEIIRRLETMDRAARERSP